MRQCSSESTCPLRTRGIKAKIPLKVQKEGKIGIQHKRRGGNEVLRGGRESSSLIHSGFKGKR